MLGDLAKFAQRVLPSILTDADHRGRGVEQAACPRRKLDACVLENRVLFSAAPLDLGVDPGNELIADANDPSESWLFEEDYSDPEVDSHDAEAGVWEVVDGQYQATPAGDAVSTLSFERRLPPNFEMEVTFNAEDASQQYFSNAFIVYDYIGPTDFKYAGGFLFLDQWVVGQRTSEGWIDEVVVDGELDAFTDYNVRMLITDGSDISLYNDETLLISHTFADDVTDGAIGIGSYNSITRFDNLSVVDLTPTSNITAVLEGDDLIVSGQANGDLRILAIQDDLFQILDGGRVVSTVEGVTGDLRIGLGDADDQVTLDLGGNRFGGSVMVNLGDGTNNFQVVDGVIRGHLKIHGGDGQDDLAVSEDVTIRKHAKLKTGSGDDSFELAGQFKRRLVLHSGDGDDSLSFSGSIQVGLWANMGDGDDVFKVLPSGSLGHHATIMMGTGEDRFTSDNLPEHLVLVDCDADKPRHKGGWKHHHQGSADRAGHEVWDHPRIKKHGHNRLHHALAHIHDLARHKGAGR